MMNAPNAPDFTVENHGSIFLLQPLSAEANAWVDEHIPDAQYFGGAVVVEHRYISDLVSGIKRDGLGVE